jgi:GNAT superfamily N-acetyltransferase
VRALVIRRALGSPRDVRAVHALCGEAGIPVGDALGAWLSSDESGLALLAERGGRAEGVALVRLLRLPGGSAVDTALLDAVYVAPDARRHGVGRALVDAARGESDAREARRFAVIEAARNEVARAFLDAVELGASPAPEAQPAAPAPPAPREESRSLSLTADVTVAFDASTRGPATVARWSGALAIRTRWRDDLITTGWSVEGAIGTGDDEGDTMRFDAVTGQLRETYLNRPVGLLVDDALLARVNALTPREGALSIAPSTAPFSLAVTDVALFDVSLACLAALRRDAVDRLARGEADAFAVSVGDGVSLLFVDGRYAGWRARDPIALARPMGWPEGRDPRALRDDEREALTSLVYDWMVIDASPRIEPVDATDPDEIAHMTTLRERARALSEAAGERDERDPVAGVARDIAAQILWGWGFYKVGS